MAEITRESLLKKAFFDPRHYPYGFSRSGDFSIKEAEALSRYGNLWLALCNGDVAPQSDEDERIIAIARGETEPETVAEKAWKKYWKNTHRKKVAPLARVYVPLAEDEDQDEVTEDSLIGDDLDVDLEDE